MADIIAIDGLYYAKAREARARARLLKVAGRPHDALQLSNEGHRLDGIASAIRMKAEALARARLLNAHVTTERGPRAEARNTDWLEWPETVTP